MPENFVLTAITLDPEMRQAADDAGVERIGIDIEWIGKTRRQAHARNADVFVRINPLHAGTREEIDTAVGMGARVIMLPQFSTAREVKTLVRMLDGRATAVLRLETIRAIENLTDVLAVGGVSEIMAGLNDFHLHMGRSNPFDIVVSGILARVAAQTRDAGVRFGFGGVARDDDAVLPVPLDLVLAQYPRLGATSAWLSRSFFRRLTRDRVAPAVASLRGRLAHWTGRTEETLESKRVALAQHLETMEPANR